MKDPKLILITGESGSGKTTIAKALKETLTNKDVYLIEMEKYFIPYNKRESVIRYSDNSPLSFYIDKAVEDIKNALDSKVFDYVIVEGTLTLYCEEIYKLSEYRIFIECSEDERLTRRIQQNMEASMDFDDMTNVYLDMARTRNNQYVEMSKDNATLFIDGEKEVSLSVNEIINYIK